jgi:hypothetical protein
MFQKEADAIVDMKNQLNLTTEGVLAHLMIKLFAEAINLKVTTEEPVRLSQKDLLSIVTPTDVVPSQSKSPFAAPGEALSVFEAAP